MKKVVVVALFLFAFAVNVTFGQAGQIPDNVSGVNILTSSDFSSKIATNVWFAFMLSNDNKKAYLITGTNGTNPDARRLLIRNLIIDYELFDIRRELGKEEDARKTLDELSEKLKGTIAYELEPIKYNGKDTCLYLITGSINPQTLINQARIIAECMILEKKSLGDKIMFFLLQQKGLAGLAYSPDIIEKDGILLSGGVALGGKNPDNHQKTRLINLYKEFLKKIE